MSRTVIINDRQRVKQALYDLQRSWTKCHATDQCMHNGERKDRLCNRLFPEVAVNNPYKLCPCSLLGQEEVVKRAVNFLDGGDNYGD